MTDPAHFLTVEDLIALNEEVLDYGGGTHGVRYESGLRYAVDRPFLVFGGRPMFPSPFDKAAALAESLIRSHPFMDGNKRTALVAGLTLLEMLTGASPDIPAEESAQACVAVAENGWGAAEFALWLRQKVETNAPGYALHLANPLCYLLRDGEVVGGVVNQGKILPLFRSRQDAEEWVVGLQVPGGASTSMQFLNTVSELKQLMDVVEQRGFSFAAVNPPPGTFLPFDIATLAAYFEHELEKALRLGE